MDAAQTETAQKIVAAVVRRKAPAGVDRADAAQTVLAAVVQAAPKWDAAKSKWPTFVQTIAQRRCIDLMRAQHRKQRLQERIRERGGREFELDGSGFAVLLAGLTQRQSEVLRLMYGPEGLGAGRAAAMLGITKERVQQIHAVATMRLLQAGGRGRRN